MSIDHILENDAFKNIEPERIDAVKNIVMEAKGKSVGEVMLIFAKYAKSLNNGHKISEEEKEAMTSAILEGLSEKEKEQFKGVLKVLEMMK